jgi:fucose permease
VVFSAGSLIWILYGLALVFLRLPPVQGHKSGTRPVVRIGSIFLNPFFLLLFAVSFLYNGTATSLVNWINTYLKQADFRFCLARAWSRSLSGPGSRPFRRRHFGRKNSAIHA